MRAVLQRVSRASVHVGDETVSTIGSGILIFLGVEIADTEASLEALVRKVNGLRIFEDANGRMNLPNEGEYLVVSQFTLCADLSKGKRPGFDNAMKPPASERMYERFCERLAAETGRPVKRGRFGATMRVELVNEGPATFLLDITLPTPPGAPTPPPPTPGAP